MCFLFTKFRSVSMRPIFLFLKSVGLIVPVLASLLPIRTALGRNLHDSLDTRTSKTKAVKVKLDRADPSRPLSLSIVLVGVGLSLFGGTIYYIFPLALLSLNLGLLLNIFFFLLIGMLLGLTMLSLNLQRIFEMCECYVFSDIFSAAFCTHFSFGKIGQ